MINFRPQLGGVDEIALRVLTTTKVSNIFQDYLGL